MPVLGGDGVEAELVDGIGWRDVFHLSPTATALIGPSGRHLVCNWAYASLLRYQIDEIEQFGVSALIRPEDQGWSAGYLGRLVSGDLDEFTTVMRFVRRDNTEVTARLRTRPLRNAAGVCMAILGTLTPTQPADRVSDERLRRLLIHAQYTFTIVDAEGRVIESSGRYQPILGYPSEFWEERTIFDLVPPSSSASVIRFQRELLDHPGEARSVELDVRAGDDSSRTVVVYAINLLADPDVNGIVISSQDITEQRRLVDELSASRTTAEAVAEARTKLLATVSHELRNPLHAVQGLAELLASEPLPARAAELATTLSQQLDGVARVTEDLLDTARFDSGVVELRAAPTDLRSLIDEVVVYGTAMVGGRPVAVVADVDTLAPSWVLADGQRLRQVLRNLVGNAVKFTKHGKVTVNVSVVGEGVAVTVADTGVGIPPEELSAVVEPFRTGSSAGAGRGAGLGLAIVHRLVESMHGTVNITSALGRGTRVHIELPLSSVAAPEVAMSLMGEFGQRDVTVLVVEDNTVNQQLARSQLEHLSMSAIIAESGEAAVTLLLAADRPHIDVILMDQQLPGMTGTETAQVLRTLGPDVASIPVIALTASVSASNRSAFLDAGLAGCISKPARLADIRSAIEEVLYAQRSASPATTDVAASSTPVEVIEASNPVLDHDALKRLAGEFGDPSIVGTLVQTFLDEMPVRRHTLVDALQSGDNDAAHRAAHTLKSSARLLGGRQLGDECERIERGGEVDLDSLEQLLDATQQAMHAWHAAAHTP